VGIINLDAKGVKLMTTNILEQPTPTKYSIVDKVLKSYFRIGIGVLFVYSEKLASEHLTWLLHNVT